MINIVIIGEKSNILSSKLRKMNLKDKITDTPENSSIEVLFAEDVKEAVLEFECHLDMLELEGEKEYLMKKYKEIFGDFEEE